MMTKHETPCILPAAGMQENRAAIFAEGYLQYSANLSLYIHTIDKLLTVSLVEEKKRFRKNMTPGKAAAQRAACPLGLQGSRPLRSYGCLEVIICCRKQFKTGGLNLLNCLNRVFDLCNQCPVILGTVTVGVLDVDAEVT